MGAVYHVGTSGWHYEEWGRGHFYPKDLPTDRWLPFYARHFDTVEVNNTFYRLPKEEVARGWGRQTPEGFLLTLKASRRITHQQRLRDCEELLTAFLDRTRAIGKDHIGSVLYQLPPYMRRDDGLLESFLALLPTDIRHAFEFRHRSWFEPQCLDLLRRYGAGLGTVQEGDYSDEELRTWAERIRKAAIDLDHIFVYFDNDEEGRALSNAQTLRDLLKE